MGIEEDTRVEVGTDTRRLVQLRVDRAAKSHCQAPEKIRAPVYVDGSNLETLQGPTIVPDFIRILDEYIEAHYASKGEESVAQFQV